MPGAKFEQVVATLAWQTDHGRYVLERQLGQDGRARLVLPTGECVTMDQDEWSTLAEALGRIFARSSAPASAPAKAGQPWTATEDEALRAGWEAGRSLGELARQHARSRGAIAARLVRLDLAESRDAARAAEARLSRR